MEWGELKKLVDGYQKGYRTTVFARYRALQYDFTIKSILVDATGIHLEFDIPDLDNSSDDKKPVAE